MFLKGHANAWFKSLEGADDMTFVELTGALIDHFASGANQWRIRQALGERRQMDKESVADYSCSVRTYCARLNWPKSEWTYHFVQGLNSEIREYVILQQPGTFEAAENFALLKEFVLASSVKPQVLDVKEMSAQVNEELKEVVTPKDKTIGSLNQQTSYFSKLDMQQIIREELQQFLSNAVPNSKRFRQRRPNLKVRKFHSRIGNRICHKCGGKGHLRYNCPAKPRRLVPRYKDSRQNDGPHQQKGQNSYNWNSNQGNGLAPLSRFEINP